MNPTRQVEVHLPPPHPHQLEVLNSNAKRIIVRAGRRGGKTTMASRKATRMCLNGRHILYTAPTSEQTNTFWAAISRYFAELINGGIAKKIETTRELYCNTEHGLGKIKAKTAWNADTMRGDYADYLIFDEWQLTSEDAWDFVGAPMLLDNDGDALFIYTPLSLRTISHSRAKTLHAAKMFKEARNKKDWAAFHWTSHDNPYISRNALERITEDMSALAFRQEILAEDIEELPGALWRRNMIQYKQPGDLRRIVVGVDPAASSTDESDHTGIIVCGEGTDGVFYILDDFSIRGTPAAWARQVAKAYNEYEADKIIAEKNQGGDMVRSTIETVDPSLPVRLVHASRGKLVRAEPISVLYEQGKAFHAKPLPMLEEEMCTYDGSGNSPDRLDAMVWAMTELTHARGKAFAAVA